MPSDNLHASRNLDILVIFCRHETNWKCKRRMPSGIKGACIVQLPDSATHLLDGGVALKRQWVCLSYCCRHDQNINAFERLVVFSCELPPEVDCFGVLDLRQ